MDSSSLNLDSGVIYNFGVLIHQLRIQIYSLLLVVHSSSRHLLFALRDCTIWKESAPLPETMQWLPHGSSDLAHSGGWNCFSTGCPCWPRSPSQPQWSPIWAPRSGLHAVIVPKHCALLDSTGTSYHEQALCQNQFQAMRFGSSACQSSFP